MARSTHPTYTAAELYERRAARGGRRYTRSTAIVRKAIRESVEAGR